jgi:hypothetical protein
VFAALPPDDQATVKPVWETPEYGEVESAGAAARVETGVPGVR